MRYWLKLHLKFSQIPHHLMLDRRRRKHFCPSFLNLRTKEQKNTIVSKESGVQFEDQITRRIERLEQSQTHSVEAWRETMKALL